MQAHILGLVTPLMSQFFAATFWALWRAGRMKRHVLGFAAGYVLFPLGYLATHLLPTDAFYLFHVTQAFYTLATATLLWAVCDRAGLRLPIASIAVVYVISAATLAIAVAASNDAAPRLLTVNTGYGLIMVMAIMTLLRAPRRDWIDIAIIAVSSFSAADFLVRPTLSLMIEQSIPIEAYRDSIYYSLIGLMLGIKTVFTAMVLIGATVFDLATGLRESSERDVLTGLHNRAAFEEAMKRLLPKAQAEGRPLSLIVADIDNFKQVNDIWGHQAGDQAIASFGRLISATVRGCDTSGRIGGEEFCIAVWDCPNQPAARLGERIRLAFARLEHESLNADIRLTAGFGVATARGGEGYESLFARADAALYEAKSNGRNRVCNAEAGDPGEASRGNADASEPLERRVAR